MKEKSRSTEIKIVVDAKDNNVDCVATVNVGSIDLDTTIELLQICIDELTKNCMVTANQNTIKYESLIMKLNELMNCISEYPWVLDTAIDGIGELIVKVNQKAHL